MAAVTLGDSPDDVIIPHNLNVLSGRQQEPFHVQLERCNTRIITS